MIDTNKSNEECATVAKAIEYTMAMSLDLSTPEVVEKFNLLESSLLENETNPVKILEIKRRVAEAIITIIFEKSDSKDVFENAWDNIHKLGYSTVEREATMLFYRAQLLIRNKYDKPLVINTIGRLGEIANYIKNKRSQQLAEHFKKVHKNLIIEMDAKYS